MMNFISPSHKAFEHSTHVWHESSLYSRVRYSTRQISLGGRIELTRRIQELISKNDFLRNGDALEQTQASMADLLAKRVYLEWGVSDIEGLYIDGRPASPHDLIEHGPEGLCDEITRAIQSEISLSEEERKNF